MPIEQNFEATNGRVLRRSENTTVTFADDNGNTTKVTISTAAFDEMFNRFVNERQENLGAEVQETFDTILNNLGNSISDALGEATGNVIALRKELGIRTRRTTNTETEAPTETPEEETAEEVPVPAY